jgi:hypothetical protein
VQEEGVWIWMTSYTKLTSTKFSNWSPGEPNNLQGNENCAAIMHATNGKWNDWHCNGDSYYACEQDK